MIFIIIIQNTWTIIKVKLLFEFILFLDEKANESINLEEKKDKIKNLIKLYSESNIIK